MIPEEPYLAGFCLIFGFALTTDAQTFVPPGPTSGHWNLGGSPYIVVDNISVPSSQTLTIDPGVTVLIGSNLTITANGSLIQAIGTPSQRIKIGSLSSSYYFNSMLVQNAPGTNRFKYCDFVNAQTAISMGVYNSFTTMFTEIMNCTFSNCFSQAIWGESGGADTSLNPLIKNCSFVSSSNGCFVKIGDLFFSNPSHANPTITGNIFKNLTGTALLMANGNGNVGISQPTFINNTMVNCRVGVNATDPWDARVQDNIFVGATNAVKVSGSLSRAISYNDFYGNATNFIGLPGTFGQIIWNNRNGIPADALYNIFQNPLFAATNDFHLSNNSPCVNAGTPDTAFANVCFPPSIATNFPDQGTYGGPDACNWLDVVPLLPVQASMSKSNNVIQINWGAIPRSEYQIQYVTNFLGTNNGSTFVMTNAWLTLTNGRVLASEKPTSLVVSNALTNRFFRIQSLGRTPGN